MTCDAVAVARELQSALRKYYRKVADDEHLRELRLLLMASAENLEKTGAALAAESERARRLHEALRRHCLTTKSGVYRGMEPGITCTECRVHVWFSDEPERHAPNCLAAPLAEETP